MKKKFSFVLCLLIVLLCFCSCAPQAASDGTSDGSTDLAADATQTEKKLPQNPPYGPQPYTYDRENRTVLSDEELSRIPSADVKGGGCRSARECAELLSLKWEKGVGNL